MNHTTFGLSKSRFRSRHERNNYDYAIPNMPVVRPIENISPHVLKVPIGDLNSVVYYKGNTGDLVLNSSDYLLYYNNGSEWVPINRGSGSLETPEETTGVGIDVKLSSGCGGVRDGILKLQSGCEDKILVGENVEVECDLILKGGVKRSVVNCTATQIGSFGAASDLIGFDQVEVDLDLEKVDEEDIEPYLSEVEFTGHVCRIDASVVLCARQSITGELVNELITENTVLTATVSTNDSGVPLVWFGKPDSGKVNMHVRCLHAELSDIRINVTIEN